MKLSDIRDEKAIAVIADLLEPMGVILGDPGIRDMARGGATKLRLAAGILKAHAGEAMQILAILSGEDPANYHCNPATVLRQIVEMLNDEELAGLFTAVGQTPIPSGSVSTKAE